MSSLPTMKDMIDPNKKVDPKVNPEEKNKKGEEDEYEYVDEEEEEEDDEQDTKPIDGKEKEAKKKQDNKKKESSKKVEEKKVEKKEEVKKEVPKKEDAKKQDEKKEEAKDKKEEPKVEGEDKQKKEEAPKKPREPEPKIPTDFTELKKELIDIKAAGNELFQKQSYEEAITKYNEGYDKINDSLSKISRERSYNPQSQELLTLSVQIMSNLSLCYMKTEKYQESIDLDLKINALDQNYDKAYIRLFKNYLKIGKKDQAVYYGTGFLKFDDETKNKYKDTVDQINEAQKNLQAEYDAIRAKQRREMIKNIAKYAIPIVILIGAFLVYFFLYKRKSIAK